MKYAKLMHNDTVNGEGITVSLWTQGCPHHCKGCHNPETWDFNGGIEVPTDIKGQIIKAISANNVKRNFSVLGGEPLCDANKEFVQGIVSAVRAAYPDIKIFLWTGYTYEELQAQNDEVINDILSKVTILIDGRYEETNRDLTLHLRGSSNQNVIEL